MANNRINPLTGKRYSWEAEQEAAKAAEKDQHALEQRIRLLKRQKAAVEAKDDLLRFTQFTMPHPEDPNDVERSAYEAKPFHKAIARHLEELERGEITQLILTLPPRSGKSELATRRLIPWFMGRNPYKSVIMATYSDTMAEDFGGDVRATLNSNQYKQVFPDIRLRKGSTSKSNLQSDKGGRAVFVGAGGAITGRGADLLVIDDLLKGSDDARSQTIRDQQWEWFTKVAMTRRMGHKLVVVIMCLTGDTPVSMADGTWKRLDQVVAGDRVKTWQDGKLVTRRVTKASAQGEDEIFEVRTGSSTVRGNKRHPFLVERDGSLEWVQLGDLRKGDMLVTMSRDNSYRRKDIGEEEAWVLGFMYGDGWVTKNVKRNKKKNGEGRCNPTASWVSCIAERPKYPDRVDRAASYMERRFGATFRKTKFGYRRTEKAALGRWLNDWGLGAGAKGKRVPEAVFRQSTSVRRAFLEGFMAADGTVQAIKGCQNHHNAKGGYEVQRTFLANEALVRDLRHLARGCGYPVTNICASQTRCRPPHSKEVKVWQNWSFAYHHKRGQAKAFTTERIRSIRPAGREVVYDLTVEGSENFIADGVVVHNTRWHSDDLVGRLTDPENPHYNAQEAAGWKIINIPAIAEEDDPLGREPGAPLWPERYPMEFLQQQMRLDPLGFAALYQQRPTVADGVLFRRENIQYYQPEDLPKDLRIYCASDHAVATGQRNDFTVLGKFGVDRQNNIWVLDVFRDKVSADKAVEAMIAMAGGPQKPLLWWAERGHISKSIGPFLRKRMLETGVYINIREVTPIGDKEQRAQSIAARVAMGKVYFPKHAVWTEKVINEMLAFPNGTHDDFVDMISYLGSGMQSQFGPGETAEARKPPPPRFGTLDWVKMTDTWNRRRQEAATAGGF